MGACLDIAVKWLIDVFIYLYVYVYMAGPYMCVIVPIGYLNNASLSKYSCKMAELTLNFNSCHHRLMEVGFEYRARQIGCPDARDNQK